MTPEEQRIKIAEACGWTVLKPEVHPQITYDWGYAPSDKSSRRIIPDYLNDLNAMHEAEKVLTYEQLPFYIATLKNPVLMKDEGVSDFDIVHATAAQRAQAFLKTLGLWKEE